MITVDIQSKRLEERLNELHDALTGAGKFGDAAMMMENEGRLFLKQVVNLTPPPGLGTAAKNVGEEAIIRDMNKLFTPVNEEFLETIGSQFGVSNIDRWITNADGKRQHIKWDRVDPTGAGMASFHNKNRDTRGRARSLKRSKQEWYAPYVVGFHDYWRYVQRILNHVGRRKAAWARSYVAIGGSVQGWVRRHMSGAYGTTVNDLAHPTRPSITMSNFSPGIGQDENMVRSAMRIRAEAIGRKMKRILNGYAMDMKYGRRITAKEPRELTE